MAGKPPVPDFRATSCNQEPNVSAARSLSYQDESYLHGFFGTVGDLQKAGVLQDVVLEVGDRRFPCHRLVLSAASPYFRAMLTSDMAESRQKTVVLQGLEAGSCGEILSYIYSGTLHVSMDKVQPLYQAADLLQLDYVRDTCSSHMAMNVERSTCVDLYKFADVFSLDIVLKKCQQWIARHFTEVASSKEFCSLSVNHLAKIISHDKLDVKEETTVWEAVVRWVQHSREDRLHHLPSILPHIRFNLLTSDDTAAILEHPLVKEDPGSSEVIRNVVQKKNPDLKLRLGMTTEMVLLYSSSLDQILFMNPHQGQYISHDYAYSIDDFRAMTVTSDNNIYILRDGGGPCYMSIRQYNHAENGWIDAGMSPVSVPASPEEDFAFFDDFLFEVDGMLYHVAVLGEYNNVLNYVRMRRYNQHTDQWQECSQLVLDEISTEYAMISCGRNLYFLSAWEVRRYDPGQDCWCKRTPPECIPDICSAVAMGTEIFCTDRPFSQTMVYNTVSDSWQELQGWPDQGNRERAVGFVPGLFILENQLHIWIEAEDGSIEDSTEHLMYVYDRSADAWRDLEVTLPDERHRSVEGRSLYHVARFYLPYLTKP
ncbi:kelch-like protein 12 [Branchiostoma floridae]|uniref:Kelch-like protein 12 n=1 Tax=Branchiostoma floridae TaxID=7739 RepID=A0A9J7MD16_BRAFL|nr:kelch-like protein 12 [Branchiostoma floridae]